MVKRISRHLPRQSLFLIMVFVLSLFARFADGQNVRELQMKLTPVTQNGKVTAIQVTEVVRSDGAAGSEPFGMTAAINYLMLSHVADRITGLEVTDVRGQVPFVSNDDPAEQGSLKSYRHWRAQRAVEFPVQIRYLAAVEPDSSHSGPPVGMRAAAGGVAGSGGGFLLLPDDGWTDSTALHWDLSQFSSNAVGVVSSGEGDVNIPGKPSRIRDEWMLAGPAKVYRVAGKTPFNGYVLGEPFDVAAEIPWAASAYALLTDSFRYIQPAPPYPVFVRVMPAPPYESGTTMEWRGAGFLMHIDNAPTARHLPNAVHRVMFHEMTHQWVGHNADDQSWFSEGLTTYFSLVLPLRGGLETPAEFLNELNESWKKYADNPSKLWTSDQISKAGFENEEARFLPYVRGAFYFARLDEAIRTKSRGKRDLLQALFPLFVAREHGEPITDQVWRSMLLRELGAAAVADFDQLLVHPSHEIVLPSGTFGPCFRLKTQAPKTAPETWEQISGRSEEACQTF